MANTIRIKRRPSTGSAGAPSSASLYNGELAFNENDNTLYYAYGSGVNGISQSVPAIAGSGAYALRGGTNATGTWPISVNGNSASVTNGVYTTGTQTISGAKTFTSDIVIGDPVAGKVTIYGSGANEGKIVGSTSIAIPNATFSSELNAASQLTVNGGGVSLKVPNTNGNSVGYFAVFDSNPSGALTQIKSVSKDQILDDIGAATSGLNITAGSGLVGGGTLSTDRRFDIGQGDGITVSADSIAVNSTVVRTTGNQDILGEKSFFESGNTHIIFSTANDIIRVKAPNTSDQTYYFVGLDGGGSPPSSTSADRSLVSRSTSQVKTDLGLNNVENLALSGITFTAGSGLAGGGTLASSRTFDIGQGDGISVSADSIAVDSTVVRSTSVNVSGYIPTWAANSSKTLNVGYQISTSLDTNNSSSFIPRADAVKTYVDSMIGSGIATNDAMIFKGAIDCSTNPNYPAADRGWTYKVSVAGKIGGASGPAVEVNDTLICTTDGTSAGTHAVVGSNWVILQTNIADASILVTGPTSATSGNIAIFDGSTGKIIKDGGFLASNIVLTTGTQTITGSKTFGDITDMQFNTDADGPIFELIYSDQVTRSVAYQRLQVKDRVSGDSGPALFEVIADTEIVDVNGESFEIPIGVVTSGIWRGRTVEVDKGGTGQTSYTNGQLLIGNSTGNTLTKATLTQGTAIDITNGGGSITIGHNDTSTLTGAQGSNGIASFTVDGMGHVTAVTTATYLTSGQSLCDAISNSNCTIDGGTF